MNNEQEQLAKEQAVNRELRKKLALILRLPPSATWTDILAGTEASVSQGAELERRIDSAMEAAGRRWEEWGERAASVCLILEGQNPYEDN